ncbi:hypothetical protein [Acinetobacter phage vB_AbaS_TCUP2199]|nr:hypothetical protein [Acinetobacter phage vB_AbaS_TCUP2199]
MQNQPINKSLLTTMAQVAKTGLINGSVWSESHKTFIFRGVIYLVIGIGLVIAIYFMGLCIMGHDQSMQVRFYMGVIAFINLVYILVIYILQAIFFYEK